MLLMSEGYTTPQSSDRIRAESLGGHSLKGFRSGKSTMHDMMTMNGIHIDEHPPKNRNRTKKVIVFPPLVMPSALAELEAACKQVIVKAYCKNVHSTFLIRPGSNVPETRL